MAAVPVFRFLAPTMLVFAIVNPLGWLMCSLGLVKRNLKMCLVIAPIMIASYLIGLPYGPRGVALAYSIVMCLWMFPAIVWCVRGTIFSAMDIWRTATRPLIASIVAAGIAWGVHLAYGQLRPVPRLCLECAVLLITFLGMLLFGTEERSFYLELFRALRQSSSKQKSLASA